MDPGAAARAVSRTSCPAPLSARVARTHPRCSSRISTHLFFGAPHPHIPHPGAARHAPQTRPRHGTPRPGSSRARPAQSVPRLEREPGARWRGVSVPESSEPRPHWSSGPRKARCVPCGVWRGPAELRTPPPASPARASHGLSKRARAMAKATAGAAGMRWQLLPLLLLLQLLGQGEFCRWLMACAAGTKLVRCAPRPSRRLWRRPPAGRG